MMYQSNTTKLYFVYYCVRGIKGQRISWLGHLERMEEDRMPKKIFTQELEGTRRRGKRKQKEIFKCWE